MAGAAGGGGGKDKQSVMPAGAPSTKRPCACCAAGCWSTTGLLFVMAVWLLRAVYYDVIIDHRTPLDLRPTQLWIESGKFFPYDGFAVWYRASFDPRLEALNPELRAAVGRRPGHVKPVVLLLHGYPGSSFEFAAVWPDLTRDFDVVTLDLLGCGASDKPYNFPCVGVEVQCIVCEEPAERGGGVDCVLLLAAGIMSCTKLTLWRWFCMTASVCRSSMSWPTATAAWLRKSFSTGTTSMPSRVLP